MRRHRCKARLAPAAWALSSLAVACLQEPTSAQTNLGAGPASQRFSPVSRADGTLDLAMLWSQGRAVGKGLVRFTHSPMRFEDIGRIVPHGMMVGEHVCLIDHGYFFPKPTKPGAEHFDVMAPADGFILMVGHRT